jgi:hypothetical protein
MCKQDFIMAEVLHCCTFLSLLPHCFKWVRVITMHARTRQKHLQMLLFSVDYNRFLIFTALSKREFPIKIIFKATAGLLWVMLSSAFLTVP